jgi:hypothetical protein
MHGLGMFNRRGVMRDHGGRRMSRTTMVLAGASLVLWLAASTAPARTAPEKPAVQTGSALSVGYASATLTGLVDPRGSATYYYFQYGPTDAYGQQTSLAEAGAGKSSVPVNAALTGLSPLTIYHYRLVAVSGAGTTLGSGRALKTTKVPLSLQIVASPDPISFGGPVTVQGTLSGTGNVNREVVLQASAFPFTAGFANVGNPELTSATGGFSFVVLDLGVTSQYRVLTTTEPAVVSTAVTETVTVLVEARHAHTRHRHRVRIYGTVTPAENGMQVSVMRLEHGREMRAGGAVLQADGSDRSSFKAVIRRHRGAYRVLATVTGAQSSAYSAPFLVR